MPKTLRARELGVSRGTLYYQLKQPEKDWQLKCRIEENIPPTARRELLWRSKETINRWKE